MLLIILLFFFIAIPLIEISVFISVGSELGAPLTIGLIILTAVVGVLLLKRQSIATLRKGMDRFQSGDLPAAELMEGLLLTIGGALLLTPGFVTDAIGLLVILPPFRPMLARLILKKMLSRVNLKAQYTSTHTDTHTTTQQARNQQTHSQQTRYKTTHRPTIIEGDYKRED